MAKSKRVLIVGENSYLASNLQLDAKYFQVDKVRRPFDKNGQDYYRNYDYIINFCIQPEHFTRTLKDNEMIDVNIAKDITDTDTKFVFLSSRKVYGSSYELKEYKETDELKPYDFYSENKATIEKVLLELIPNNLIILRTGNIIGEPVAKKNYKTFVGWLEKELEEHGRISCTFLPDTRKDFITRDYFHEVLNSVITGNALGTYNAGAGFALPIEEILNNLLPPHLLDYTNAVNKSEQFILRNDKLSDLVREFTQEELIIKCKHICECFLKRNFCNKGI